VPAPHGRARQLRVLTVNADTAGERREAISQQERLAS
jgi:hypothetical protein